MSTQADPSPPWEEGGTSTIVSSCSSPSSGTATGRFIDDLIVEILSRVPAKTVCRFKCVSKRWLSLTNDRNHRKKLPQTLAGVFCSCIGGDGSFAQFTSVTGSVRPLIRTSLAFLPNDWRVTLLDGCNGLLLVLWCPFAQDPESECNYAVCNPATEKWVSLPEPTQENILHMGLSFDPAVSSHFQVFSLLRNKDGWEWGVEVYSSETGTWVHKENEWNGDTKLTNHQPASVLLNGYMHFHAFDSESHRCLAVVDTKGEALTPFRVPGGLTKGFVQLSQGCLHYANFKRGERGAEILLVVYVLKDYGSKEWTLKHSVETSYIFGGHPIHMNPYFDWIMIHPDCNLIFFTVGQGMPFVCYNMDSQEIEMIPDSINCVPPCLPYVPLYSELPSLQM